MTDGIELVQGCGIEWLQGQGAESIDGVFTDPPWGAGPAIQGQENWKDLIRQMSSAAWRALRHGGRFLVWIGVNRLDGAIRSIDERFVYSGAIVVRTIPPSSRGRWALAGDHVLVYGKGGYARPQIRMASGEVTLTSGFGRFAMGGLRTGKDSDHPCPRDLRAAVAIARQWFAPGERVVDPFGGSAVISCALADVGARAVSVEVDPKMHVTAVTRVEARTPNLFKGRAQ